MATPAQRLADSLDELRKLQEQGITAFESGELSRTHRERLVENGFLKEITVKQPFFPILIFLLILKFHH